MATACPWKTTWVGSQASPLGPTVIPSYKDLPQCEPWHTQFSPIQYNLWGGNGALNSQTLKIFVQINTLTLISQFINEVTKLPVTY